MRLFCFSDTHQKALPTCEPPPYAWLFAGDLYDKPNLRHLSREDVAFGQTIRTWLEAHAQPIYAVRGNHDLNDKARFFEAATDLSEGAIRSLGGGLFIAGIGSCGNRFFELPEESHLQYLCNIVENMWSLQTGRLILMTHYAPRDPALPPDKLFPDGFYFNCVGKLIQKLRPLIVIAGHCHDQFGKTISFGDIPVLFPGPMGKLLTIDSQNVRVE